MNGRARARWVTAVLGAVGLVAASAMLAWAAPRTVHRGAAAAAYCLPSEKANKKQARDQAVETAGEARAAVVRATAALAKARRAARALAAAQLRAKQAYFATHASKRLRAAFVAKQAKATKHARAKVAAATAALARARTAAANAAAAAAAAQAVYGRCS
ncbi:MAG: hypothetical protein ACJ76I_14060 [Gaiellaceae bacterium]